MTATNLRRINQLNDKESELEQKFLCASYNNSIEISSTNICDGKFDCKDKIDENNCPEVKCNNIGKLTEKCNYKCQNERTQGELLPRASCFIEIVYIACFLSDVYATKCDEKIECSSDMYWEECHCESESEIWGMPKCPLMMDGYRFFNCESYNPVPANAVCDGVKDCNNGEEEEDCANRFYCANPSPIHIDERKVCDGLKDCNDFSDELGCSDETHFYCQDNGEKLFINPKQICDGTEDCGSGKDECFEKCITSVFADVHSMIKSDSLVAATWIMGETYFHVLDFHYYNN
ncbi:uncharacterized protein LOC120326558 [Styela clava]